MTWAVRLAVGVACVGVASCGGGGGGASCTPGPTAAITISAAGTSPTNVCVEPDGTVTFTNSDTASHDIEFDNTTSCPAVGDIAPGTSRAVAFPTQVNCSYHDGRNASNASFQGTVAVTSVTVTGGGY